MAYLANLRVVILSARYVVSLESSPYIALAPALRELAPDNDADVDEHSCRLTDPCAAVSSQHTQLTGCLQGIAAGINTIDTSPWYGNGKAEEVLGKVRLLWGPADSLPANICPWLALGMNRNGRCSTDAPKVFPGRQYSGSSLITLRSSAPMQLLADIPRDAYYLATKAGRYEPDKAKMFDFRAERIIRSVVCMALMYRAGREQNVRA